jgi:diguanylate cyclase (GGDEF)-like protein
MRVTLLRSLLARGRSPRAWRGALYGAVLSLGAPLGLLAIFKVSVSAREHAVATALIYSLLGTACAFSCFGFVGGLVMQQLWDSAMRDGLTGLFNRRYLMAELERKLLHCQHTGQRLCVLMMDLDHFKRVNDTYGHLVGDATLSATARALMRSARGADVIARYGGEEFVCLVVGIDSQQAEIIAERYRACVAELGERDLGHPGPQTISLGAVVAAPFPGWSAPALLERADAALYAAKHAGRNRAVVTKITPNG